MSMVVQGEDNESILTKDERFVKYERNPSYDKARQAKSVLKSV